MIELFREKDLTRIGYYQSLLESEGIKTFVRNENTTMLGLSEIPIPEFYPALCIINETDHQRAIDIIKQAREANEENSAKQIQCSKCGEENPGNFDVCWACENPLLNG